MPYHYFKTKRLLEGALEKIQKAIYLPIADLDAQVWITSEPVPYTAKQSGLRRSVAIGESWGRLWDCAWFNLTGTVPQSAAGQKIALLIDLSGEGCVFDDSGCPVLGLTTQSSTFDFTLGRPGKRVVPFLDYAKGGEPVDIWVDAGNNDLFGVYQDNGTLKEAHIAIFHENVFDLYHDFRILYDLMQNLPEDRARHHRILVALHNAMQCLSESTSEEIQRARQVLAPELAKVGGTPSLKISSIGHAHIDLAWLWPIRETIRKGARTFSTVLHMMERYPDYVFGASQPQVYQWMKDYYPALYEKIKQKVTEGRWEAQGAMWVEPDTNIPGGESLIRQVLYGKRFFQEEFGVAPKMLWLPDVFGYTGALPQILAQSGVDYFMTQKLSWNIFNRFPHHTFLWEGIDGSQILAHMPPENTYNSAAEPHSLLKAEKSFADKVVSDECLLLFGIGDGGGGPGTSHLEALKREKNLEGLPPVTQERSEAFFERIGQDTSHYKAWVGELYMERHQGTYTTQARSKWYNRKLEIALRELELWAALFGDSYPQETLQAIWKEVLLYQFHDILPGSSITRVYDESLARYAEMLTQVETLIMQTDAALVNQLDLSDFKRPLIVKNSLSWERNEWVSFDGVWFQATVPAMGYSVIDRPETTECPEEIATPDRLENDKLVVQFDEDGTIRSVFDKENKREVLDGPGNRLAVYMDAGDAWDIEYDYRDRPPSCFELIDAKASIDGPLAILHQKYQYGNSTLDQSIILCTGSHRIDFVTDVDWQENNKMLRTSFPVAVHTREVTCDIQFGTIKRSNHQNTSWDMAQHEICAHQWVDLSQSDYGVALLNDCKYGHHVDQNVIDVNLLRSPSYPDPVADRATHRFTYVLYPHQGDHVHGQVDRAAQALNVPLRIIPATTSKGPSQSTRSFMHVDSENVIIETVKKAEDSQDLIVRMYEANGTTVQTRLHFGFPITMVSTTNLMEIPITTLPVIGDAVDLSFTPFGIVTLKVNTHK